MFITTALLTLSIQAIAFGEFGKWSNGWGQGVSEYISTVSKGNSLYIACSDEAPVTMILTVNGIEYGSSSKNGFNLVIDGKEIQTPYDTSSRVGAINFDYTWSALRKAKKIQAKTNDGNKLELPIKGAVQTLPESRTSNYHCKTDF